VSGEASIVSIYPVLTQDGSGLEWGSTLHFRADPRSRLSVAAELLVIKASNLSKRAGAECGKLQLLGFGASQVRLVRSRTAAITGTGFARSGAFRSNGVRAFRTVNMEKRWKAVWQRGVCTAR
jgi:hypothetical protein